MLQEPPLTMGEIDPETYYTEVSEIVYAYCVERDEHICIMCGKQGGELHHIVYRSQGGKHNTNNLSTLCKTCHDKTHAGKYGPKTTIQSALLRKVKVNDRKFRRRLK